MDRLISEKAVLEAFREYQGSISDFYKAIKAIPSAEPQDSEDKIIRRTLENFMRGLWEEIQVGELEYTTSEVYEMLEREIFTDNHVAVSSKNTEMQGDDRWLLHFGQNMAIPSAEPQTGYWILSIEDWNKWTCSECGYSERTDIHVSLGYDYCPKCGARMVEPQERSEE